MQRENRMALQLAAAIVTPRTITPDPCPVAVDKDMACENVNLSLIAYLPNLRPFVVLAANTMLPEILCETPAVVTSNRKLVGFTPHPNVEFLNAIFVTPRAVVPAPIPEAPAITTVVPFTTPRTYTFHVPDAPVTSNQYIVESHIAVD